MQASLNNCINNIDGINALGLLSNIRYNNIIINPLTYVIAWDNNNKKKIIQIMIDTITFRKNYHFVVILLYSVQHIEGS